jgi:hypothetical protein
MRPLFVLSSGMLTTGSTSAPLVLAAARVTDAIAIPAMPVSAPPNATRASCEDPRPGVRTSEDAPNGRHEVQEDEACEQHQESTDATIPLVVARPLRPILIWGAVVGCDATRCEPAHDEQGGKRNPGQSK